MVNTDEYILLLKIVHEVHKI